MHARACQLDGAKACTTTSPHADEAKGCLAPQPPPHVYVCLTPRSCPTRGRRLQAGWASRPLGCRLERCAGPRVGQHAAVGVHAPQPQPAPVAACRPPLPSPPLEPQPAPLPLAAVLSGTERRGAAAAVSGHRRNALGRAVWRLGGEGLGGACGHLHCCVPRGQRSAAGGSYGSLGGFAGIGVQSGMEYAGLGSAGRATSALRDAPPCPPHPFRTPPGSSAPPPYRSSLACGGGAAAHPGAHSRLRRVAGKLVAPAGVEETSVRCDGRSWQRAEPCHASDPRATHPS